ncbi:MAG: sulfite exporter TauE/SafE family protein [bacterium]
MDTHFLLLALFTTVAYTIQAMTGFGSLIIAITLGSHLYPVELLLATLVPVDVLLCAYIAARNRESIQGRLLLRGIVPFMGLGLASGIAVFQFVHGEALKRALGLLVVFLCSRELYRLVAGRGNPAFLSAWKYRLYILAAGIVQGVFASGGPLTVYAVSRFNLPKAAFRSTLSSLWMLTNSVLAASYLATGRLTLETLRFVSGLVPFVLLGLVIGDRLHHRVNEVHFRMAVFAVLILAGLSVLIG